MSNIYKCSKIVDNFYIRDNSFNKFMEDCLLNELISKVSNDLNQSEDISLIIHPVDISRQIEGICYTRTIEVVHVINREISVPVLKIGDDYKNNKLDERYRKIIKRNLWRNRSYGWKKKKRNSYESCM